MTTPEPTQIGPDHQIQCLVAEMVKKRPMLESLIRPFAALFIEKARLAAVLKIELDPAGLSISPKRLPEGVPILAGISFDSFKPALDRAFAALAPVLKASFPAIALDLDRIEAAQRDASLELNRLAETYLEGRLEGVPGKPADNGNRAAQCRLRRQYVDFNRASVPGAIRCGLGQRPPMEPGLLPGLRVVAFHQLPFETPKSFLRVPGGRGRPTILALQPVRTGLARSPSSLRCMRT